MSTDLGCPWETHERQPCKLLEYAGTLDTRRLPLLAGVRSHRETVNV